MKLRTLGPLALAVLAIACSRPSPGDASRGATKPAGSETAVTVKGSDTLVILVQRLAEEFMKRNPGKTVQVTGGGTGTGIASLINGTTDIANASRPMKDSERAQVEKHRGLPAVEHPIALDGLAIYVHRSNPIESITLAQLKGIYTGEITNWKELGGPDARILLYSRENNSGTYAFFKERVLEDEDFVAETLTLPGTAAVVNAVARDRKAIGYGGIAFDAGVRTVPVKEDGASPAVEATLETVSSGRYPLSRTLFMYTAGEPEGDVKAFIDFARSEEGQRVAGEVGYYPLPKQATGLESAAPDEADGARHPE